MLVNTKEKEMYLDYKNNFLTVQRFAEFYDLEIIEAFELITKVRAYLNN